MKISIGLDCSGMDAPIEALAQLKEEGFSIAVDHAFSSDIDPYCVETIRANSTPKLLFRDITKRNTSEIPYVDLYIAGFPCQAFSSLGKKKGFLDERGTIFFKCFEVIKTKKPKIFILENVKALLRHDRGKTFKVIQTYLDSLKSYSIAYQILNTKDYGIPQNRERLYIVGIQKKILARPFTFPPPQHSKNKLIDFVDLTDTREYPIPQYIIDSNLMKRVPKDAVFLNFAYPNDNFPNSEQYVRCITTTPKLWNVPMKRYANVKELLALQGFRITFKQVVSDTQMKKQIGNTMSVNVLKELFKAIFSSVDL